ncbi:MAG: glycosyltransferase family 2 protein [Candidatus Jacksonbacteria bacterium]
MKIFIIIPAYNEAQTIRQVIQDVQKFCSNIIVVDDGSSDDTYNSARTLGVKVLRHIINRGQGAALQTGIEYAFAQGADIIVTFDGDGQHMPSDIINLIKPIEEGKAEVVLGSRFLISNFKFLISNQCQMTKCQIFKVPLQKIITLKLALLHQWFFSGLKVSDNHCGLRAFSRSAAQKIKITQDRMSHASEILDQIARYKLSYIEVPVSVRYTNYSLYKGQKSFFGSLRIIYDFLMGRVV